MMSKLSFWTITTWLCVHRGSPRYSSLDEKLALVLWKRGVYWAGITMGAMGERASAIWSLPPHPPQHSLPFARFVSINPVRFRICMMHRHRGRLCLPFGGALSSWTLRTEKREKNSSTK